MQLNTFVENILENKSIEDEIELGDKISDAKSIERLCRSDLSNELQMWAWSCILNAIADKYYPEDMTNCLTKYTIDYLIENQIALQDLGHLQLNSEILMKIYNKDNRCKEALQTVQNRKY